jgi:hypothetical protein
MSRRNAITVLTIACALLTGALLAEGATSPAWAAAAGPECQNEACNGPLYCNYWGGVMCTKHPGDPASCTSTECWP